MKSAIAFILFLCISTSTFSQYRKIPLDTNHYWNEYETFVSANPPTYNYCEYQYNISKDTLIGGNVYQKIIKTNCFCSSLSHIGGFAKSFLRQDTVAKKVFILDNNFQERTLYNFQKDLGDTAQLYDRVLNSSYVYTLTSLDSVLLNDGNYHKRYSFNLLGPHDVIEGVGGYFGFITPYYSGEGSGILTCMAKKYPVPSTIYHRSGNGYSCDIMLGEKSLSLNGQVAIYPNPVSDKMNIRLKESNEIRTLTLSDLLGKNLLEIRNMHSADYVLDLESFQKGIYFLSLQFNEGSKVYKIIKE